MIFGCDIPVSTHRIVSYRYIFCWHANERTNDRQRQRSSVVVALEISYEKVLVFFESMPCRVVSWAPGILCSNTKLFTGVNHRKRRNQKDGPFRNRIRIAAQRNAMLRYGTYLAQYNNPCAVIPNHPARLLYLAVSETNRTTVSCSFPLRSFPLRCIPLRYTPRRPFTIHGCARTWSRLNRSLGSKKSIRCNKSMASQDKPVFHSVSICTRKPPAMNRKRSSDGMAYSQGGYPVSMVNKMTPAAHMSTANPSKGSSLRHISGDMYIHFPHVPCGRMRLRRRSLPDNGLCECGCIGCCGRRLLALTPAASRCCSSWARPWVEFLVVVRDECC